MKLTKEIYILTHKKLDYEIDLSKYICLQLGASKSNKTIYTLKDSLGDNISEKNSYFSEVTGIYWIWKNSVADIKGQMQYRRFISVNPDFVETLLNKYDIIITNPAEFGCSVYNFYDVFHNIKNMDQIFEIISELYPEYIDSYNLYIKNNNTLIYSNSFIAKREIYDNLCKFCFDVIFKFDRRYTNTEEKREKYANEIAWKYFGDSDFCRNEIKIPYDSIHPELPYVEYQKRICGFLFERLVTLYVFHNELNYYNCGEYMTF